MRKLAAYSPFPEECRRLTIVHAVSEVLDAENHGSSMQISWATCRMPGAQTRRRWDYTLNVSWTIQVGQHLMMSVFTLPGTFGELII